LGIIYMTPFRHGWRTNQRQFRSGCAMTSDTAGRRNKTTISRQQWLGLRRLGFPLVWSAGYDYCLGIDTHVL
jgi:hypothetical protein